VGVSDVPDALRAFGGPWWIAGGWAADMFLGEQTREHEDVDVVALRRDRPLLEQALAGREVEEIGERQLRLRAFDVLFDEADGDDWVFRRNPRVRRPLCEIGLVRNGLPILAPELVLLYKAKQPGEKDEADHALLAPRLDPGARKWLAAALNTAHAGHPWLEDLL
jgi:Aminoglycoside-2''-adenylyltransferase